MAVDVFQESGVTPRDVHRVLAESILADGLDYVLDLRRSSGSSLIDERNGERYLDMFTFFASNALGMNHPSLAADAEFKAELLAAAINKPSNSDVYSVPQAEFTQTFDRVLGDPRLPHRFFIEGGALAVENALKVAFDWKSRHNEAHGRDPRLGAQVMHLTGAFHGRSGYTMSLTNTEPNKTARFPKFDWPRIETPALAEGVDIDALEADALQQARDAFARHPHDIACFIAEPIQGEGGDRHLRPQFLQAMQRLCHANDALFILDEVQTGCGITGEKWAYQLLGLEPDIVAFGKKLQVCGIMAGGRVDEVADNVFHVSSRLNSTWGGNLTDMVRARRILQVIERDDLVANARERGDELLNGLRRLAARYDIVSNPRGRGLMCAISLPDGRTRDKVVADLFAREHVVMLGCGPESIRFRPALTVTSAEIDEAITALDHSLSRV